MLQSNFIFLEQKWTMLANLGKLAEKNIYQDSNTSLAFKLSTWFMQIYGDWDFKPNDFIMHENINEMTYINKIKKESEELTLDYENKLKYLQLELDKVRILKTDETSKQRQEKSGVWFLDARISINHPKALQSWYTPKGLKDILDKDIEDARKSLEEETFEYLKDPKGLNLRKYQINAIKKIEESLADGVESILISMATGERVIIVMGAVCVIKSRVSGTLNKYISCIA